MTGSVEASGVPAASPFHRKAAMIVPLALFFLLGAIIDTTPTRDGELINGSAYFALVMSRVAAMTAAITYFGREIFRQFEFKIDAWGWAVGVVGAVLWIGVCHLGIETSLVLALGLPESWLPAREGVDPFATYEGTGQLIAFLIGRFALLAICVPIAEELFLRGFIMRAFETENWTELSLSKIGRTGLIIGTVYGIATHPGEFVAAALWFSLVSWLMMKTGRFWNCVLAHAITNLILGIYICLTGEWRLW